MKTQSMLNLVMVIAVIFGVISGFLIAGIAQVMTDGLFAGISTMAIFALVIGNRVGKNFGLSFGLAAAFVAAISSGSITQSFDAKTLSGIWVFIAMFSTISVGTVTGIVWRMTKEWYSYVPESGTTTAK